MSISIGGKTVESIVISDKTVNTIVDSNNNLIFGKPYLQKNYIQSSGTQYIDLGFTGGASTQAYFDLMFLSSADTIPCGSREDSGSTRFYYLGKSVNSKIYGGVGNYTLGSKSFTLNTRYKLNSVIDSSQAITITNAETSTSIYTKSASPQLTPSQNLYLFGMNNGGSLDVASCNPIKLYNFKFYASNALTMNLVPCTLTADIPASKDSQNTARTSGTVGMWDTVTDKFYANAGTGTFVAG